MKSHILAALALLSILALPVMAAPPKLAYQFKEGTKLTYTFTFDTTVSDGKQSSEIKVKGASIAFVTATDIKAGTASLLINNQVKPSSVGLGNDKGEILTKGKSNLGYLTIATTGRRADTGRGPTPTHGMRSLLLKTIRPDDYCLVLPTETPQSGKWQAHSSIFYAAMAANSKSKIEKIEAREGKQIAHIAHTFTGTSFMGMDRHETSAESLFNITDGVFMKTEMRIKAGKDDMTMTITLTHELKAMTEMAAPEAKRIAALAEELAKAIALVEANKLEDAQKHLKAINTKGLDEALVKGLKWVEAQVDATLRFAAMTQAPPPATQAMESASKLANAKKWKEAAAAYEKVAADFPDPGLTHKALLQAARIHKDELNDEKASKAILLKTAAVIEKRLVNEGGKIDLEDAYRLARTYERMGDARKAIEAYRLVAQDKADTPDVKLLVANAKANIARLEKALK
jgi:tetratricopeptide (TPR) repeat protein